MKQLTQGELCLLYLALGMAAGLCSNLDDRLMAIEIMKLVNKLEKIAGDEE